MNWKSVLYTVLLGAVLSTSRASEYTVIDLGPGEARGLNNLGVAVGFDETGGFLYGPAGRQPTPPLVVEQYGITQTLASVQWQSINDAGQMVGTGMATNSLGQWVRHVIIWNGQGTPTVLPHIPNRGNPTFDTSANPVAINSSGNVAGGTSLSYPFYYSNGVMVDILATAVPETPYAQYAFDLNDSGTVAVGLRTGGWIQPGVWKDGQVAPINYLEIPGDLTPVSAYGTAINNVGQVAGNVGDFRASYSRGFLTTQGVTEAIDVPGGVFRGNYVQVMDLNEGGVVVGQYRFGEGPRHGYIYRNSKFTDLETLIPQNGWSITTAYRINESSQIVGTGMVNGKQRAFLLTPLDPSLGTPPTIISNPVGGQFSIGQSTTLSVVAHGSQPLTYQWFRNETNQVGGNSSQLVLNAMNASNNGVYSVVVKNAAGEAFSSLATISVLDPEIELLRFSGIAVSGELGGLYEIQSTPTMTPPAWMARTRITLTNSPQVWIDLESGTNTGPQFYRSVRVLP